MRPRVRRYTAVCGRCTQDEMGAILTPYRIAMGLMIICTAPFTRAAPSTNMNS